MTWVFDNTEVLTIAAIIATPIVLMGMMLLVASGNTKDAHELEGFNDDNE